MQLCSFPIQPILTTRVSMFFLRYCVLFLTFITFTGQAMGANKIIIAANGAGRNLIDHTLPAVTLAATKGVEYLELHVVMTADDHLLVFRELTLNNLTDVAELFPDRKREDGSFYVIDFSLREIRQLRLINSPEFGTLPLSLAIPTLEEELALIRHLETLRNQHLGIALEIRQPWFHQDAGKDISSATLDTLFRFGYTDETCKLFLQCFDPDELQRIHGQLMPEKQIRLPLIQLIGKNDGNETQQKVLGQWEPYNYDWLFTNIGLRMITSYAAAIGLPASAIADQNGNQLQPQYVDEIHKYGMQVLAFPVNNRPEDLPSFAPDFKALLDFYLYRVKVDGIYTDSFDEVRQYQEQRAEEERRKADLPPFFSSQGLTRPSPADPEQAME